MVDLGFVLVYLGFGYGLLVLFVAGRRFRLRRTSADVPTAVAAVCASLCIVAFWLPAVSGFSDGTRNAWRTLDPLSTGTALLLAVTIAAYAILPASGDEVRASLVASLGATLALVVVGNELIQTYTSRGTHERWGLHVAAGASVASVGAALAGLARGARRDVRLRPAVTADATFLEQMLAEAVNWDPARAALSIDEIRSAPELAHYVAGWRRPTDVGVVAEIDGQMVGAAWLRFFTRDERGYGFVESAIPEVSIGVVAEHRGEGIGRRLLDELAAAARQRGITALSLSVELENPARRLYERAGYREVARDGAASTMVVSLSER